MNEHNFQESWQVEVSKQIYESSFEELTQWIMEGALLPQDMVRRGNLRWIEARKVPSLLPFFNAKEQGLPLPTASDSTTVTVLNQTSGYAENKKCVIHTASDAAYKCEICISSFCESCISPVYNPSKICPMCGAVCQSIARTTHTFENQPQAIPVNDTQNGFVPMPTNQFQANQFIESFPSDVANQGNKKGMGMFAIVFLSVVGAGIISYLWAYQFYSPNKIVEDSLPQIVSLVEKYNAEKEAVEKKVQLSGTGLNSKAVVNLDDINKNGIKPGSSAPKISTVGPYQVKLPPMPDLNAFNKQAEDMQKALNKKIQNTNQLPASALFPNQLGEIEKKYTAERTQIIESYHSSKQKNSFIGGFFLSFLVIFGCLFGIKSLQNKETN